MVDQINDIASPKVLNPVSSKNNENKTQQKNDPISSQSGAEDSVRLSNEAQQLDSLKQMIQQAPEVDSNRVNEIKQALAAGELEIDSQRLAKKILEFESL